MGNTTSSHKSIINMQYSNSEDNAVMGVQHTLIYSINLNKLIRKAGGIIGCGQNDIDMLCKTKAIKKIRQILNDSTHPLHEEYKVIPRSGRVRMPKIRTSRFCNSFVPRSIAWSNENFERK